MPQRELLHFLLLCIKDTAVLELPCATEGYGSSVVMAVAQVAVVAWVQSPAWKLPRAMGTAKKKKKKEVKLSLFTDDIIIYIGTPKESTTVKKPPGTIK